MSAIASFMSTPSGKVTTKIVAVSIVGVVLFFVIKALLKNLSEGFDNFQDNQNFDDIVANTPTQDGSVIDAAFKPTAKILADQFEVAMEGAGTSDSVLFGGVIGLDGGQLQQVYAEFGNRANWSLFQWYASDLGDSFSPSIGVYTWSDYGMTSDQAEALGCDFWSGCVLWSEIQLMKAIWVKSGLPLSF